MWYSVIDFNCIADSRGSLIALEQHKEVPFNIKRIYYLFNPSINNIRGEHAHKNLEQLLICLSGSCTVDLDNGIEKASIFLNSPAKALYVKPVTWRVIKDFSSSNCVVLTLASDYYDESDYIRSYSEFQKYVNDLK